MKSTKKELKLRIDFLKVYSEFDNWLTSLGFRCANFKESTNYSSYHWSHYNEHIYSLYSVERYLHDILNLSINFMRDRFEHKIMFVGEMGSHSTVNTIEQAKELILIEVRKLRDEQLSKLSALASF
jgi:hypothetical protein